MPYIVHLDPKINCAFFKFTGEFEFGLAPRSINDILDHPDYQSGMNYLRDIRDQPLPTDVNFQSISQHAKRVMMEFDNKLGNCKLAIVVGDAHSYQKMHQFIVTRRLGTNPVERKLFREIKPALEWLGVPVDYEIVYPETDDTI